ncbi:MAG: hypothetical protein R2941_14480 [Desulfobacterales bacterium]
MFRSTPRENASFRRSASDCRIIDPSFPRLHGNAVRTLCVWRLHTGRRASLHSHAERRTSYNRPGNFADLWTNSNSLFLFLFLFCSCQRFPEQSLTKDGKPYGITNVALKGEWWHYYERGLSFAHGEFWKQAEADLRKAIHKRDQDRKKARTYGRHWLDLQGRDSGYFPHRELGIVLYQQGRLTGAIRELEISLANEKSARAAVYLDRARKAVTEQQKSDHSAPKFSILSPEPDFLSNVSAVLVRGKVTDDTFVRHIRVGDQEIHTDLSGPSLAFSAKIPVQSGRNVISVFAEDLTGKKTHTDVIVHIDRIGPVISMENLSVSKGGTENQVSFRMTVSDDSGIMHIAVNGEEIVYSGEKEIQLEREMNAGRDENALHIAVTDRAGNRTAAAYAFSDFPESADCPVLIAEKGNRLAKKILLQKIGQKQKPVLTAMQTDHSQPVLTLDYFNENRTYETFLDEILIEGNINDENTHGEMRLWFNRELIRFRSGQDNRFSCIHVLKKGINSILVRGRDAAGNEARREIRIMKKDPAVRKYNARLRMLIKNFAEDSVLHTDFHEILDTVLFEKKRFQTVKPDQVSGSPPDCVLEGCIWKKPGYIEIKASLYFREDSSAPRRIANVTADAFWEPENRREQYLTERNILEELARRIYLKLAYELPLTEGKVIERDTEKNITTDLGEETRIKEGMDLIVFQKNPQQQEEDFPQMGTARIQSVKKEKSHAAIRRGNPKEIREGQYVITR